MAIENVQSAQMLLAQVAAMAANAGKGIDKGAGSGYVGLLNGVTVKLATHWGERNAAERRNVQDACDALRTKLQEAARLLLPGTDQEAALTSVLEKLGLSKELKPGAFRPLITRSIALSVVQTISKAAKNQALNQKLAAVTGERTVKNSRVDDFKTNLGASFEQRDAFILKMEKAVRSFYPASSDKAKFDLVMEEVSQSFILKNGQITIADVEPDNAAWTAPGDHVLADSLSKILTKAPTPGKAFHEAVAAIYGRLAADPDADAALTRLAEHRVAPYQAMENRPTMPSAQTPGAVWKKPFAVAKSLATILYPAQVKNGKTNYPAYQTWLLNKAAAKAGCSIDDLTPKALAAFIRENWDKSPAELAREQGTHEMTERGERMSIAAFFYEQAADAKSRLIVNQELAPSAIIRNLEGDDDELRGDVLQLLTFSGEREFTPELRKVYNNGGSLVLTHEETFAYDESCREVTSRVAPKNRFSSERSRQQVASLAETELARTDVHGRKQVLFKGVRFGNLNLQGHTDDIVAQHAHYGKLIEQLVLANDALRAGLKEGDTIELPVYRVDMADDNNLCVCASEYKLSIDGKNVTVRPKVAHFRVATDGADLVTVGDKREWRMMSKAAVEQNDRALEQLLAAAKDSTNMLAKSLAFQLENYWNSLKTRHGDGQGNIHLFEGYGAEMMQFGARIALLAQKLGSVPAFNCTGGRDRTGLMDVECKTLALYLADHTDVPAIKYKDDDLKALRTTMRDKSGNQEIARELKLNHEDMYTNQVGGSYKRLFGTNPNGVAMPQTIRANDGDPSKPVVWIHEDRRSGLDALYVQSQMEI